MLRNKLFYIVFLSLLSGCSALGPTSSAPVLSAAEQPAPGAPPSRPERSEALLQALLALGLDYRYGGNSPVTGFDCSGLVAHVYRQAWGIRLPHSTPAQR